MGAGLSFFDPQLSTLDLNLAEQSQNVYENKGPCIKHLAGVGPDTDNMSIYPFVSRR